MKQRTWIILAVVLALAVISCQKSIREPGEPEHGGPFLHGPETLPTTR